jgi:hypothetical protein
MSQARAGRAAVRPTCFKEVAIIPKTAYQEQLAR